MGPPKPKKSNTDTFLDKLRGYMNLPKGEQKKQARKRGEKIINKNTRSLLEQVDA